MNNWNIIWQGYHSNASLKKLVADVIRRGTVIEKGYLLVCLAGLVCGAVSYFFHNFIAGLMLAIVGEIGLLQKLKELKQRLILSEFGEPDKLQMPPDEEYQTRYLLFKTALEDRSLIKSDVSDCFNLVDMQIDIAASSGLTVKKLSGVLVGFLAGIGGAVWDKMKPEQLLIVAFLLFVAWLFAAMLFSIFPSKIEKLKEMKYFMMLYCKETKEK